MPAKCAPQEHRGCPLSEVSRVHADLNRIGGLLKLAICEGLSDPSGYNRLNLELIDSVVDVRGAVNRLAGQRRSFGISAIGSLSRASIRVRPWQTVMRFSPC